MTDQDYRRNTLVIHCTFSDILHYLDLSALHNRAVQLLSRPVRLRRTLESHEAEALRVHTAMKSVYKSVLEPR